MIAEAIDKILSLRKNVELEINGRKYTTEGIVPVLEPHPDSLLVDTLSGVKDYISSNRDRLNKEKLILLVADSSTVSLFSSLDDVWFKRNVFLQAKSDPCKFPFGNYIAVEEFIVAMQTQFVQDENTGTVLSIVGNVKDGTVKHVTDDGFSQKVEVRTGPSRVVEALVPNPVLLRPYRTFREVYQPASLFVLRIRSRAESIECALFEADGGRWKNDAMMSIKDWLDSHGAVENNIPVLA